VLTCAGNAFAGRVAASLLAALDLPELVAANLREYEMRAMAFAHSPIMAAEVRAKLAHQRATRPLFDTDLYRRHLESAYLSMSERRHRGDPTLSFSVPAIR
jgi:predicted O-linked N-acetylglucosamine transferase (SPINDLY family)